MSRQLSCCKLTTVWNVGFNILYVVNDWLPPNDNNTYLAQFNNKWCLIQSRSVAHGELLKAFKDSSPIFILSMQYV